MAAVAVFDGEALRARREALGISRELLAVQIGRSFSLIFKYEHGAAAPSLESLRRIAAALDCSADELLRPEAAR